jgi:hypothetical protein
MCEEDGDDKDQDNKEYALDDNLQANAYRFLM